MEKNYNNYNNRKSENLAQTNFSANLFAYKLAQINFSAHTCLKKYIFLFDQCRNSLFAM